MSQLLLCLGGTGQLVLHHWLLQWLLGHRSHSSLNPLRVVLIDSDQNVLPSVRFLQRFLKEADANVTFEIIAATPPIQNTKNLTFGQYAAGLRDKPVPAGHTIEAFWDAATRNQPLLNGMYRRVCHGPLWWNADIERKLFQLLANVQRVTIACSAVGGTGGGLVSPAIAYLLAMRKEVGLIQFPRWYRPNNQDHTELEDSNFRVLPEQIRRQFEAHGGSLFSMHTILGPATLLDRNEVEAQGRAFKNLPLSDLFLESCQITDEFMTVNVAGGHANEPRQIASDLDLMQERKTLNAAALRLVGALRFLGEAIGDAGNDPLARRIWPMVALDPLNRQARKGALASPGRRGSEVFSGVVQELRKWTRGAEFNLLDLWPIQPAQVPASPLALDHLASLAAPGSESVASLLLRLSRAAAR